MPGMLSGAASPVLYLPFRSAHCEPKEMQRFTGIAKKNDMTRKGVVNIKEYGHRNASRKMVYDF
jgi:hypothetical protein